uniref:Phenylalanine--tRNA ligase alpha subunit n=1 Tax=Eptatretus burgeri TaxID=7764 RepID=A0A8C4QDS6_EPTBU
MAEATLLELVLQRLAEASTGLDSCDLADTLGHDHQAVVGAIKSLQSLGEVIWAEQRSTKRWELTKEGREVVREGSHEARVFDAIPPGGILQKDLMKLPSGKVGFSKAMSNKWIVMDKTAENGPRIFRIVDEIADYVKEKLQIVAEGKGDDLAEKEKTDLKKRKLLNELIVKSYWITKGPSFSTTVMKQETDLTSEMITSGSWRGKQFKPYNFDALGIMPDSGHLHPLMKVRSQFRQIFLEMGFTEMPTNNYIESSFWNFDALFQPQQHPARDAHDTFFISDPALASQFPMDYLERVNPP